jgi:hypothetical protein
MTTATMVEAQNLSEGTRVVSVDGDTYDPPAQIRLDMRDRRLGWVWVRTDARWYRLGIYEWVEVA